MSLSPLSILRFKIIFGICWIVFLADQAIALKYFGIPWQAAILDSLISNLLLASASLLIIHILRFYLPRSRQYINILALCIFLSITWLLISNWLLKLALGHFAGYSDMLSLSLPVRFSVGFLILGCITMISILWYQQLEQKEKDKRKTDAEKMAKEAELFKLRQQLQPHFLFNSLNSINALIGNRPEEARKMVQQLSDFLRGTLKKEETQWVTLREEIQYLQLYLDIEKVRFGNRLATELKIDEQLNALKLPALLLQPIMENAIKFGLYDTTGEITITLIATRKDDNLIISIQNPFDPETSSPKQGTGFGLKSVHRRLYLLFARNDLLTTETKDNYFITVVKIPQS
ncbi:MAG: histidine kinase [Chitinophagaceae bacterium]